MVLGAAEEVLEKLRVNEIEWEGVAPEIEFGEWGWTLVAEWIAINSQSVNVDNRSQVFEKDGIER